MDYLSMLKLPCVKRVKFASCLTTEYGAGDIEPVEAGTELEGTAETNAVSDTPTGPFKDELFLDSWSDCENVRDLTIIAGLDEHQEACLEKLVSGTTSSSFPNRMTEVAASYVKSIRAKVPDWLDWSMIPLIRPEEDDDDAEFLIALLAHCIHVVKSREGQVGEYIADIIIDAFYEYEPSMLLP